MTVSITTKPRTFSVRRYAPEDLPDVLNLLRLSLGESETLKRSEAMWNWKHRDNWFGASHVLVATGESGEIVGLRALLRWGFTNKEKQLLAVRAVDTSTHPEFRRLGMFSKLTLQAVNDVRSEGTDLVFNTPNDRSRPGYLKMGWSTVGQIRPQVKILNYPKFALGLARYKLSPGRAESRVHSEEANLLKKQAHSVSELLSFNSLPELIDADMERWGEYIHTERSSGFLTWRYANHPTIRYKAAWVERNGRLAAAAIFRLNSRFGMREIVLSEVLLGRSDRKLAKELISAVSESVRGDYMISYSEPSSEQSQILSNMRFRRIPIGAMTLTYNPLSDDVPQNTAIDDWGLGMGDLEFF